MKAPLREKVNEDSDSEENETEEVSIVKQGTEEEFKLYPYRWKLQVAFSLAVISTNVLGVGFSPISEVISVIFNCNVLVVEGQTLIFLACFIPASFIGIHLLPKKGLKYTLILGAILMIIGAWLRLLVNLTGVFGTASIGSIFAAFGQTFFYQCVSKISS
jgi:hypothetical protein